MMTQCTLTNIKQTTLHPSGQKDASKKEIPGLNPEQDSKGVV